MLKILLSSVGMHDPFNGDGKEGPVMGAVQELQPDILFLFPTRRQINEKLTSTEENSRATIVTTNYLPPRELKLPTCVLLYCQLPVTTNYLPPRELKP